MPKFIIEPLVDFVIGAIVVIVFFTLILKVESEAVISFFAMVGGGINCIKSLIKNF
jgi:hypothetical protein